MRCKRLFLFVIFSVVVFFPLRSVSADLGPKPTMEFTFVQAFDGKPVTIVSGVLLQCDDSDCQDAEPLQEMGPQRFTCQDLSCRALAYGFREYNQLEITFSDGVVRRSNVFPEGGFNGLYNVTIREDGLLVTERFNPRSISTLPWLCLAGFCLTLVLIAAVLVFIMHRLARKA